MTTCACGNPTRDQTLVCDSCVRSLVLILGELPWYADQLRTGLSRQSRLGGYRIGGRSAEKPLAFDWGSSEALWTLANTLTAWHRTIRGSGKLASIESLCTFLIAHADWVRTHPEGPQMVDEFRYLARELRKRIDRPADWYAGPCRSTSYGANVVHTADGVIRLELNDERVCTATLWTRLDAKVIVCPECKAKRLTVDRREWLVAQVEDALVPLNMLVDALPTLIGVTVSRDTARKWVGRGRLVARGLDGQGNELFSGGDVMELARNSTRRKVPA